MKAAYGNNIEVLVTAVALATQLRIGEDLVIDAREHLQTLRDEAERRTEVEDEMSRAEKAEDIEGLATSIERGKEIGANENAVKVARDNLTKLLEKALKQAEQALTNAVKEVCIEELEAAIVQAEQAGAGNQVLTKARKRLQVLTEEARKRQE